MTSPDPNYRGGQDIRGRAFEFACGRLRVHVACTIGPTNDALQLLNEANALVAIIGTIVSNARANSGLDRSAAARRRPHP